MVDNSFFDEAREQSEVKMAIVAKYFDIWSQIIVRAQERYRHGPDSRIAYIDLFAGRGLYRDGIRSTPILVLERAISNPRLRQTLVTIFNDKSRDNAQSLEEAIRVLPGVDTLKHRPVVMCSEVDDQLVQELQRIQLVPTLLFADPWGYKGLSRDLVNSVLRNWGSDCIIFFNYNSINRFLGSPGVKGHMDALFGQQRAGTLRQRLPGMSPEDRQLEIVDAMCGALEELGGKYYLPFCFMNDRGTRISHHLIFVSKHPLGYQKMKEIMADQSSDGAQGVASFHYSPAEKRQPFLFEYSRPLEDLEESLLSEFAGQTLTMHEIYERHNVGRPYIERNYKAALMSLEGAGKITAERHRRGTFGPNVKVTLPPRED